MDYAESRVYQPGDDVRRLDWRLTARSGELHTKLFQEEREGRLLILLDTHASMRFGTRVRFKSVQAARAAALAGWYAVRAGERVGAMASTCSSRAVVRAGRWPCVAHWRIGMPTPQPAIPTSRYPMRSHARAACMAPVACC